MIYIKVGNNFELAVTKYQSIYRGENQSTKITFLIPNTLFDVSLENLSVRVCFLPIDGVPIIAKASTFEEYNDHYYQFEYVIGNDLTQFARDISVWLQFCDDSNSEHFLKKTSVCKLHICDSPEIDTYMDHAHNMEGM